MRIPYALTAALSVPKRNVQALHALSLGFPRLRQVPMDDTKTASIACYGPSLKHTWQNLTRPIISMSGATKWLIAHGVVPDYHVDMDPRANKVHDVDPPHPGVKYLMASICCPEVFAKLKGYDVTLWHTYSGTDTDTGEDTYNWVHRHDPGELVVHGGSTIGLTAIHLAGVLGYRHLDIHGMDGSFEGDDRHAGPHTGKAQPPSFTWDAEGVTYRTSQIMANAVAETINTMQNFPVFCVFHGNGLTQALIREANLRNACTAEQTDKVKVVRNARPMFLELPPVTDKSIRTFWDALLAQDFAGRALLEVMTIAREAESRRHLANYNTGTVPIETALLLRVLSYWFKPRVVVEVGTFIGTSTLSLERDNHVYTCDESNNCVSSRAAITCHPFTKATTMLEALVERNVSVDMFFFDGRLTPRDVELIQRLSHPGTVYALDDCVGNQKGTDNTALLMPALKDYALVPPNRSFEGRSSLAALLPLSSNVRGV